MGSLSSINPRRIDRAVFHLNLYFNRRYFFTSQVIIFGFHFLYERGNIRICKFFGGKLLGADLPIQNGMLLAIMPRW